MQQGRATSAGQSPRAEAQGWQQRVAELEASLAREVAADWLHVACWAHARRKFDEALCTTSHSLLHEALAAIRQLYGVEDQAAGLAADARCAKRSLGRSLTACRRGSWRRAISCVPRGSWAKRSSMR